MPFLLVKSLHFQDRHHCHQKVRVLRLPEIQARKRSDKNEHYGRLVALETDSRCSIRIWDTIEPRDNGDDDFWSFLWWWWWAKQWQLPVCSKWLYIARGLGGFDRVGSSIRLPSLSIKARLEMWAFGLVYPYISFWWFECFDPSQN